ncbi:hypothetical protein FACS189479_04940 [Spirochaetia bacterium]|nr:hypothetical protein FACS189479_04940 [Spirochaetia bacterium]
MAKAKQKKKPASAAPDGIPIEPISLAELARRAHTTRQAAGQWVKQQNDEGADLFVDDGLPGQRGRRSRKVNALNPLIDAYVNDPMDKAQGRDPFTAADVSAAARGGVEKYRSTMEKIKQFTRKLEIKNAKIADGYVPRTFAFLCVDTEIASAKKHMKDYSRLVIKEIEKTLFGKATKAEKKELELFKKAIDEDLIPVIEMLDRTVKTMKDKAAIQYEEITESTK